MIETESITTPKAFLSFCTENKALVDLFRNQVTSFRRGLVFRDYSIMEPVAGAWKLHAEHLIRESNVTICLVGEGTWRSEPVNWEIRKSAELGKRILAVYLESSTARPPKALIEVGTLPMPWDLELIVDSLYNGTRPDY